MTQEEMLPPNRLQPLMDILKEIKGDADSHQLLGLSVEEGVRVYIAVPPGQVAVGYRNPVLRPLGALGKPTIAHPGRPFVERNIKYVQLDPLDVQSIRDAGSVKVERFHHGGLGSGRNGLFSTPFRYCAIRRDRPNPFVPSDDIWPEALLPGTVYPVEQAIQAGDLLVSSQDWHQLLTAMGGVDDRWGHKYRAPSVFLVYRAAHHAATHRSNHEEVMRWIRRKDENRVFKVKISEFAARIIKKDAIIKKKKRQPSGLATWLISNNALGNDYREDVASDRLSLLHLATDYWLHDKENPSAKPLLPAGGVRQLLSDIGFEDLQVKETQAEFLRRIIENERSRSQFEED